MDTFTPKKSAWNVKKRDRNRAGELASALSLNPITALLLLQRGIRSPEAAQAFFSPSLENLHDPFLFDEMERAVSRILVAVEKREKVVIYGDYDLDGITGTAVYVELFKELGHPVEFYIPHRLDEGYGLHAASLRALRSAGAGLIITSDCGTASHAEISEANRLGLEVIVTDHHLPLTEPLPAAAFLNPYAAQPIPYSFEGLSSAGMAFKVAQAVFKKAGIPEARLRRLLDLVALGTVADVAPLIDENRFLVTEGLASIREGMRLGIRALLQVAGIDSSSADTETIRFHLAPRLNAAGRLYHAGEAVTLLTTTSWKEALQLAERMDRYNRERQDLEALACEEAERQIGVRYTSGSPSTIVVASEGWHPGVVGIVAAQIVARHGCPAIAIALSPDGVGKGSGRSARGLHLHRLISGCAGYLERFGGHAAAIGLTIHKNQIDLFRDALEKSASVQEDGEEDLSVDAEVDLQEVTFQLAREIGRLAPFGPSNPEPVFSGRRLRLNAFRKGRRFVQFKVRKEGGLTFDVSGPDYYFADSGLAVEGSDVDLAFSPRIGLWQGEERIFLTLKGIRAASGEGPATAPDCRDAE